MSLPFPFLARKLACNVARIVAQALILTISLSACDSTRRALGYDKAPPDEFQVVQRAPLSMPPDFNLRPPTPGLVRPQEGSPTDQARSTLLGTSRTSSMPMIGRDAGDAALLKRTGAELAQPGIRNLVDKESLSQADADQSFTDKLEFWSTPASGNSVQVDPVQEAARLQAKNGVKATGGPRIERPQDSGLLGGVGDSLSAPTDGALGGIWNWLTEK